ncbi:MAG: hypothetical protein GF388_03735 [Candidatus Aegiribacteria sp.]|nr:hypothetical protein [Candidatus Aegiribacteria sp.]MBD3294365.1 hypothetical protein [Candidatus Fermentibacteria bacterium]
MNLLLVILSLQLQVTQSPSEMAAMASELYSEGRYSESAEIWSQLLQRMPHRGRIAYNAAAALFNLEEFQLADSILSGAGQDTVGEDTLTAAESLTGLALAISTEDYGGVQQAVSDLSESVASGGSFRSQRIGLEAGLNWLDHHEPPEDQQDNQDQEDQQQDDQQDQQDDQDQEDQQQDDQQEQQDDQDSQAQEDQDQPQPPPEIGEMTPQQAQAILDLVEENAQPEDSTAAGKAGIPSGPVW